MAVRDIVIVMEQGQRPAIRARIGTGNVVLLEQDNNQIVLDTAPPSVREFLNGVTVAVTAARQVALPEMRKHRKQPCSERRRARPIRQRGGDPDG